METFFRHSKGGGRKYGESEACPRTFLSKTTALRGNSDVFESIIENSETDEIVDSFISNAQIVNSCVYHTKIAGKVRVENSLLFCKSVAGSSRVIDSIIEGESRIYGTAEIRNSSFKNLSVGGTARILDWNDFFKETPTFVFDGCFGRITTGIWMRPPRIVRFDDLEITITESVDNQAFVGCISKPMSRWISGGHRFGRVNGWSDEKITRLIELFTEWLDTPVK